MPLGSVGAGSSSLVVGSETRPISDGAHTYTVGFAASCHSIIRRAVLIIEIVPTWGHVHVDVGVVVDLEGLCLCHRLGLCVHVRVQSEILSE